MKFVFFDKLTHKKAVRMNVDLPALSGTDIVADLRSLCCSYPGKVVFTTSFGLEDQVVTHLIYSNQLPVALVTLDTGRLFEETYKVFSRTREKYEIEIETVHPDAFELSALLKAKGPFSFYQSVENRKECCNIRKVKPLRNFLSSYGVWITGLRSEQSDARSSLSLIEYDENYGILKYNPLINWTIEQVRDFISLNHVPYNVLHDRGFPSIGCEPCTRAISPGEDIRSGRWWWEQGSKKECGLHKS